MEQLVFLQSKNRMVRLDATPPLECSSHLSNSELPYCQFGVLVNEPPDAQQLHFISEV